MPNYCNFQMRLEGDPSEMDAFELDALDYSRPLHFWRVFDLDRTDGYGDDSRVREYAGCCAWSVRSCMRDGKDTYAHDRPERSCTLDWESRHRRLRIEVYSTESAMCFAEHYLFDDGEVLADECVGYEEWVYDPGEFDAFEEFAEEYGLPKGVTEGDFDDCGVYAIGGFGDWSWTERETAAQEA